MLYSKENKNNLNRRRFFKYAGGGLAGALLINPASILGATEKDVSSSTPIEKPHIKHYRQFGKTGLKVSDISLGAGAVTNPSVIDYALDVGINYFDTAEAYVRGKSEEAIGKVARRRRDKMIICTKLEPAGEDKEIKKENIITRFESCLKKLQTDYVDVFMIHGGDEKARKSPIVYEVFDQLKKDGKIKFSGISHHGPELDKVLHEIISDNKLDAILFNYDPTEYPDLPNILKEADQKGFALVAMKVILSSKKVVLNEFKDKRCPYSVAALRWGLSNPHLDCIIASMNITDQIDTYLQASGAGLRT